jgi:hypothetical protein
MSNFTKSNVPLFFHSLQLIQVIYGNILGVTNKELFARFFYVIAYVLAQRVIELPMITFTKSKHQLVLPHHDKLRTSLDVTCYHKII